MEIAADHPSERHRPWYYRHAKIKAENDADLPPWSTSQVRDFSLTLERTPRSHRELADLLALRIADLKDDLEKGDNSLAGILRGVTQETELRNFIGRELRNHAQGRFIAPQEEELADAKRMDIRLHGAGFDSPVPLELKIADNWSGPELFERLENQLAGDYLRDNRSVRGLFLLVYRGEKSQWELPVAGARVDFEGLLQALEKHWRDISPLWPAVEDIRIFGIDLTKRDNKARDAAL